MKGECADPPVDVPAVETIVHEGYVPDSKGQGNDIALVRLSRATPYTDYIRPVCLPVDANFRTKIYDSKPLIVAGFGKTETSRLQAQITYLVYFIVSPNKAVAFKNDLLLQGHRAK